MNTANLFEIIHLLSQLIVFDLYDFHQFLKRLIRLLTKIIDVDSCFIYIMDDKTKQLTLIASKKSKDQLMGKISMQKGEGITGWVAEHLRTVVLPKEAYKDKRFKSFKELPEDRYEAFLSVPIINRSGIVGVVNLQNREPFAFTKEQVKTLEAVVKLIASAFEKMILERKVEDLQGKLEDRKVIEKAKGVLMKTQNLSEREAYNLLQKEAMKKRKSMKDIAEAVLLVHG